MPLVGVFLWVGACVGHVAILSVSLNLWYGRPFHKSFLSLMRKLHTLLVPVGPLFYLLLFGFQTPNSWSSRPGDWLDLFARSYCLVCWVVAFVALPLTTAARLLRPTPKALLTNHTQTIDVAEKLGYKPIGDGKYQRLARLPGNQVFQVDFTEKTFQLPQLPSAWDGLTMLHLTDLHFCGTPDRKFYLEVINRLQEWECDILAVTGDIVDSDRHHRWVVPLLGRLRWKIAAFGILGNHDVWYEPPRTRRRLERIGIQIVSNCWQSVDVRGQPMIVVGHEGPWFTPEPDLSSCPSDGFRLCLSHTPDNMPWARRNRIDLVLAGHNHGGQIRLPVIGSIIVPSRFSRRYDCGIFFEPPTLLHVGRGLGGQHPLRYNCRPEVTKITLRSGEAGA